MKAKRILSAITALSLLPAIGAVTGVPEAKAASTSATTVRLNPADASPFNNGEFEGWGTSLCWWANRVGYNDALTQQAAQAFFSETGLGLDIARYNIGGGDDQYHNHIERSDSKVPGVWESFEYTNENKDVSVTYDITNDKNQLNVAKAALAANPNIYFEGFSNSPPYFMTNSGCSSGAEDASSDNLRTDMYDDFAKYIAEATKLMKQQGINFQSYSPMNEPDTNYWGANSPKQEGCHYDPGDSQSNMIVETRKALDAAGFNDVLVAGMDETSIDSSVKNLDRLTDEAKAALGRIDTHTYSGSNRSGLKAKAVELQKDLWMSEVDGSWDGFGLADRIIADMNGMMPSAWVIWDIIDIHKDSNFTDPNGNKTEADNSVSDTSSLWGVGMADHDNSELVLTNKYYAFGQFTKYINPGDTIIASSNSTLAAYNKESGDIKIVASNSSNSDRNYIFDLSAFTNIGSEVTEIRTSDSGEKWANITNEATLADGKITTTLKARSVTTYIVNGRGPTDYAYISGGGNQLGLGDSITLTVLSNLSGADDVKWSVSDNSIAEITPEGVLTAKSHGTVTVYAAIGDFTTSRTFEIPLYKLSGTASWNNSSNEPKDSDDYTHVADGDFNTYFDGTQGGWVMYDYGTPYKPDEILLAARSGKNMQIRTVGGTVQGSNDAISWTDLYKISSALPSDKYTVVTSDMLSNKNAYRYFRYTNNSDMTNIAEFIINGAPSSDVAEGEPSVTDIDEISDNFESDSNIFGAAPGDLSSNGSQVYASGLERFSNVFAPIKTTSEAQLSEPITLGKNQRFRFTFNMFAGWEEKGKDNTLDIKDADGNSIFSMTVNVESCNFTKLMLGDTDLLNGGTLGAQCKTALSGRTGANGWDSTSQPYRNNVGYNKTIELLIDGQGGASLTISGGTAESTSYTAVIDKPVSIASLVVTGNHNSSAKRTVCYDNFDGDIITYAEDFDEPEKPVASEPPILPESGELIELNFDNGTLESGSSYGKADGTPKFVTADEKNCIQFDGTAATQVKLTDANGNSLLTGVDEMTISFKMKPIDTAASWMFFAAPNDNEQSYKSEKYFGVLAENGSLKIERYNNSGSRPEVASGAINMNEWNDVVIIVNSNDTSLYINGMLADTAASAVNISDMLGSSSVAYLGKANWKQGEFATGYIDDFVIYNHSILSNAAIDIDTSNLTADIELPAEINGNAVTWTTSDESVITADGKITRADKTQSAVLTATVTVNGIEFKQEFTVTVLGFTSAIDKFTAYADGNAIKFTGGYSTDTPYNMYVAVYDSNERLIGTRINTAEGSFEGLPNGEYKISCYIWNEQQKAMDDKVTKTVIIKSEFETDAYLFAHFVGNEADASHEQIYFSVSEDGQNWTTLNDQKPVLTSTVGEQGVRDPYILRGEDGKFFIIATDLSIYNRQQRGEDAWSNCQKSGSKSIVVWESADLVHWEEARLVEIAVNNAGCTWAPEAIYDPEKGMYMVFWASKISDDNFSNQRMYKSYTIDFKTFTEPEIFIETDVSNIDTTIIEHKGIYYRFTKNESNSSVIMEKSRFLDGQWSAVEGYNLGTMTGYEGPLIYKLNGEDKWCLLLDAYASHGGYKPFVTDDLESGVFTQSSDFTFDGTYRHGTVMPITRAEYNALIKAYGSAE